MHLILYKDTRLELTNDKIKYYKVFILKRLIMKQYIFCLCIINSFSNNISIIISCKGLISSST
jgi:hypothetical protein